MNSIVKYFNRFFVQGIEQGIISILFTILIAIIVNHLINKILNKSSLKNIIVIKRIKKIMIWCFTLASIFMQITPLKSMVTALLASGGIIAVVIGIASQEAASNLLNGSMILIYKPFIIGDFIILSEQNVKGYVKDISLHHTVIETLEKTHLIIPNSIMNRAIVENVSNVTHRKANHFFVDIAYNSDIQKAIQIIQEEGKNHPLFLDNRTKKEKQQNVEVIPVHCTEYKDSGITLRATITTKDNISGFELLSDLRIKIVQRFQEEGIEIPFPHHVVIKEEK